MSDNVPVFNIFLTQPTVIFSFLIKKKLRDEFWNNNIYIFTTGIIIKDVSNCNYGIIKFLLLIDL